MGDFEGAPAVHFNLPLLSFYLYTTFKRGIVAASEPIPSEYGRFGDWQILLECNRGPYILLLGFIDGS